MRAVYCVFLVWIFARVGADNTTIDSNNFIVSNVTEGPMLIPGMIGQSGPDSTGNEMNSTTFMSVMHYYCAAPEMEDEQLLVLYGTKSWTFPEQDVNLTLSYPSTNPDSQVQLLTDEEGYMLTAFKVVLYIDGLTAKGYIVDGGILRDSLTLMFVCSRISSLSYEFWLYGTPKHTVKGNYNHFHQSFVCT